MTWGIVGYFCGGLGGFILGWAARAIFGSTFDADD